MKRQITIKHPQSGAPYAIKSTVLVIGQNCVNTQ